MKGKIIKGIAGFYYVHAADNELYECKAKGLFRNQNIKPLVGDNVLIAPKEQGNKEGIITEVLPRENQLIRPAVANITQAMVIFAAAEPKPNFNLLDRFLITMERQNIETIICFNKMDIVTKEEMKFLKDIYLGCGYKVIFTSVYHDKNLSEVGTILKGKTTVVAGPSGVGKSSIINIICPKANMQVGSISEKIKRGKHTTRHSELLYIDEDTYVMDTPGFSFLTVNDLEKEDLRDYFIEFRRLDEGCKFQGCVHINEPNCAVKDALDKDEIHKIRYESYLSIYKELENEKKY